MLTAIQHQREATRFLRRVADGALVSPLLLIGPAGVGKRHSIRCLIREVLCTGTRLADCECAACYQVQRNLHPDIVVVTATKAIQVDDVRGLIAEAGQCPTTSKFKALIVDGADRFTTEAGDALLKTLEEPPATSRFFLLAEDLSRVPSTIRSRCGAIVYRPLPEAFIVSIVQRIEKDSSKALVYSRMGMGSVGRAVDLCSAGKLALRDQVLEALTAGANRDLAAVFSLVDAMTNDLELALTLMEQAVRDVLICPYDSGWVANIDVTSTLEALGRSAEPTSWVALGRKLRGLRSARVALNMPFQLKTALAEMFV